MKNIQSFQDLAINGALPAFKEVLHVGSPNIGSREVFIEYVNQIFDSRWLSNNGQMVQELEHKIAEYHQVKNCVAMCNGTVALEIAIRALELKGEVILPSYTFIATAHALSWQEITPVFADISDTSHTLDPESVRQMITPRTSGIIGVHLWGNTALVEALQAIADEYSLKLMFDAAHAFGCSRQGKMVGNFGECEVLSFHATKFFNTFEGGAVLTNNDDLAEKMRLMRNFGFAGLDNVIHMGSNGKMTEISAAMGLVNMAEISKVIEVNKKNYHAYCEGLKNLAGLNVLKFDEDENNNYQYIVIELNENSLISRDNLIEALHAENIRARKYFWPGCHNMKPYKELYPHARLLLPKTANVAERVIVLPTGSAMDINMIEVVTSVIRLLVAGEK